MKITLCGDTLRDCAVNAIKDRVDNKQCFSAYNITQSVRGYVGNLFNVEHEDVKKIVHEYMEKYIEDNRGTDNAYLKFSNGTYIEYKHFPKVTTNNAQPAARIPVGTTGKFFVGDLVKLKDDDYYKNSSFQGKPRKIVKIAGISNDSWIWCDFDGISLWTHEDELELVPTEPVVETKPTTDSNITAICQVNKAGLHIPKCVSSKLADGVSVRLEYSPFPGKYYYTSVSRDSRGDFRLSRKKLDLASYTEADAEIPVVSCVCLNIKIKVL